MSPESEFLTKVYKREGEITGSTVVRLAKMKNCPLHSHFEWDDSVAGHKYRLVQARRLIRITPIEVEEVEQPLIHVQIKGQAEGQYHPKVVVLANPSYRAAAFAEIERLMASMMKLLTQLRDD